MTNRQRVLSALTVAPQSARQLELLTGLTEKQVRGAIDGLRVSGIEIHYSDLSGGFWMTAPKPRSTAASKAQLASS